MWDLTTLQLIQTKAGRKKLRAAANKRGTKRLLRGRKGMNNVSVGYSNSLANIDL